MKGTGKGCPPWACRLEGPHEPIGSFPCSSALRVSARRSFPKALAEALSGDENAMVRIDIVPNIWKSTAFPEMVGSPPGYVGYEDGRSAEPKRLRRKSLILLLLFDEIEKASPERVLYSFARFWTHGHITGRAGAERWSSTLIRYHHDLERTPPCAQSNCRPQASGLYEAWKRPSQSYELMKKGREGCNQEHLQARISVTVLTDIIVFQPLEKVTITERIVRASDRMCWQCA